MNQKQGNLQIEVVGLKETVKEMQARALLFQVIKKSTDEKGFYVYTK